MRTLAKKLFKHELISGSTYFFIGTMLTNIFAFLFNFFVARKLNPSEYGIYASLLSLFGLVTLLPQSFSTTIIQFASEYFSKNEVEKSTKLYWQSMKFLSILGIIIFIVTFFGASAIGAFLHITNIWFIISVGFLIVATFISTVNSTYLQSLLQFGFLSFIQALGAGVKFFVGVILVTLGFGIFGALGAFLISIIIPFILSFTRLQFVFSSTEKKTSTPLWEMVQYALPAMITSIALSSFISTDVILAKHFLPSSQAGLYAGLSLVGKVIFYFTGIIPAVMFPILIRKHTKGQRVHNTFYLGLLLVGIPSFILTGFYFFFPNFVITFFLGGKQYLSASGNIGLMAFLLTLYSIISVMVNFFLSLRQTKVVFPVAIMALLQIILISFFHATILQMIIDSLVVAGGLIVLLSLYYIYHQRIVKTYIPVLTIPQEL